MEPNEKDGPLTDVLRATIEQTVEDSDAPIRAVMKDGQVTIRREYTERYPPASRRTHKVNDSKSLVRSVEQFGEGRELSVLMLGASHAVFTPIDYPFWARSEEVPHGERETFTLDFERSREWKRWGDVINKTPMGHKQMLRFFTLHAQTLVNPSVLASMEKADIRGDVQSLSDLRRDSNELSFTVKTAKGEGLMKFPEHFDLRMPVLELDRTSEHLWKTVRVRLLIDLPDDPKQPVQFSLLAPEFDAIDRQRMEDEYEDIEIAVGDKVLVLRGECGYVPRVVTVD